MPTFYEIIEVAPSASPAEIEQAVDAQYNQCRRLVTHHDPSVVARATQALQLLETIRATLMNPEKRMVYDAVLGADAQSEHMAGLADPTAAPPAPRPAPQPYSIPLAAPLPSRAAQPAARPAPAEPQGWTCPRCKTVNVINSQFCKSCGESLASPCPNCSGLVEKGAQFCSKCGVSIESAQRKKEMENQLAQLRYNLNSAEYNQPLPEADVKDLGRLVVRDAAWSLVSLVFGLLCWLTTPGMLPGFNITGLFAAAFSGTGNFGAEMGATLPLLATLGLLSALFVLLSVIQRVFPLVTWLASALAVFIFMTLPASFYAIFELAGATQDISYMAAWTATALIFPIFISRIVAAAGSSVESLNPFYPKIPNLGCLGIVLSMVFYLLPLLYAAYVFLLAARQMELFTTLMNEYEPLLLLANGLLFNAAALLLTIYGLLAWRTSLAVDNRYKQAISERALQMERYAAQIKSLEQALPGINVRER